MEAMHSIFLLCDTVSLVTKLHHLLSFFLSPGNVVNCQLTIFCIEQHFLTSFFFMSYQTFILSQVMDCLIIYLH